MFYWLHPYYGKFCAKLTVPVVEVLLFFGGHIVPAVIAAVYEFVRVHSRRPAKHANQLVKFQTKEPYV